MWLRLHYDNKGCVDPYSFRKESNGLPDAALNA
jgi:hypothetical protein